MKNRDMLFREPVRALADFSFDERTARVFDDMVVRSVPFYAEIQRMVVELAGAFMQAGTRVYDLGCSTGTTLLELARAYRGAGVQFIGVDSSGPMLDRARAKLARAECLDRCVLTLADLDDLAVERASVVIMILTLQFIRPAHRELLVRRLHRGLASGGALILVEKVLGDDARLDRLFVERHHAFKKRRGYSELEIAQKREALENVLIPSRLAENLALLSRGGFSAVDVFFRWYNFAGILAVKRSPT